MNYIYDKLSGKIIVKKTKFFGLIKKYAIIIILPSLKIVKVKTNIKNLPFLEKTYLDLQELLFFSEKNNFEISHNTKNKILKRLLSTLI